MTFRIAAGVLVWFSMLLPAAAEEQWRALYLEQQAALVVCEDAACFRSFMQHFGSAKNTKAFKALPDAEVVEIFDRERDLAKREMADPAAIELEATVKDNRATLYIRSRTRLGLAANDPLTRRFLVQENGGWRIGE